MEVTRASKIIKDAFESQFNKENFYNFINQLLKNIRVLLLFIKVLI